MHSWYEYRIKYINIYIIKLKLYIQSNFKNNFQDYKSQTEDENESFEPSIYGFNKFSHIAPWIYNITDKLDLRDVPSLLMAERYLKGLYCLSSDYFPGNLIVNAIRKLIFNKEINYF